MSTALIVDDDRELRALLSAAMVAEGFEVREAASGVDADVALTSHTADVIVVDGRLPDGSGVDWIARRRKEDGGTPMIFMSAYLVDGATVRRLTDELGVAVVLKKPLDPSELARCARDLSPRGGASRPPPEGAEAAFEDALAELVRDFAAALPQRVEELSRAVAASREDRAHLPHARGLAHRLRGTAGCYGFVAVGDTAGRIEDLLTQISSTDEAAPRAVLWHAVEGSLADAAGAASRPPSEQDPISGLLVRRPFFTALERALADAARQRQPLSLAVLEIDGYERILHELGYGAGDAVVAKLGALVRHELPPDAVGGRLAGGTILVAFPGRPAAAAIDLLGPALRRLADQPFTAEDGHAFFASVSGGAADAAEGESSKDDLLQRAQAMLHAAKSEGAGRLTASAGRRHSA